MSQPGSQILRRITKYLGLLNMFKKYSLIHSIVIDWHSSYTIMKHKSAFTDRYSNRSQEQRYCLCLRPMHERQRSLQRSLKPWKFHSHNRLWTCTFTFNDSTYQHHVLVISESKWWKQSNSERNEGLFFNSSTRFTYHNHLSYGWLTTQTHGLYPVAPTTNFIQLSDLPVTSTCITEEFSHSVIAEHLSYMQNGCIKWKNK